MDLHPMDNEDTFHKYNHSTNPHYSKFIHILAKILANWNAITAILTVLVVTTALEQTLFYLVPETDGASRMIWSWIIATGTLVTLYLIFSVMYQLVPPELRLITFVTDDFVLQAKNKMESSETAIRIPIVEQQQTINEMPKKTQFYYKSSVASDIAKSMIEAHDNSTIKRTFR
jgi:hypothetical protein